MYLFYHLPSMKDTSVIIVIPNHCSSLKYVKSGRFELSGRTERKEGVGHYHSKNDTYSSGRLLVQCHRERLVWNQFKPLFNQNNYIDHHDRNNHHSISAASKILIDNFYSFVFEECYDTNNNNMNNDQVVIDIASIQQKQIESTTCTTNDFWITSFIIKEKLYFFASITIFILPPYPTPSSSLHPEYLFTSALVRFENFHIRLQSLNAYISTLGGGYFLCRYLSVAVQLAQSQREVAIAMGDLSLADKCLLNVAYSFIYVGQIKYSLQLIRTVKLNAKRRKDKLVISMCRSARFFAKQVASAGKHEDDMKLSHKLTDETTTSNLLHTHGSSANVACSQPNISNATFDDYQRVRVVHDRKILHV